MVLFNHLVINILLNVGFSNSVIQPKFHESPHNYWDVAKSDPFTKLIPLLQKGTIKLDHSNEVNFLKSLLEVLNIHESSQLQLFSTTSLQLSLITPSNPRALYFNEKYYIGYIPGGKVEVISIDPTYGAVFYIFKVPHKNQPITITPTKRCMNCHANRDLEGIPGLLIKSVLPGLKGGSLDSYRTGQPGHNIPYHDRFGGWYITDLLNQTTSSKSNVLGYYKNTKIDKKNILSLQQKSIHLFPTSSSELLVHLIFDHQAGFINRVIKSNYLFRMVQQPDHSSEHNINFKNSISELVKYTLFLDEPKLSVQVNRNSSFESDFLAQSYKLTTGESLKDLDLNKRLFKYRCSYMLLSDFFVNNPPEIKNAVFKEIKSYLTTNKPLFNEDKGFSSREKEVILELLKKFYK